VLERLPEPAEGNVALGSLPHIIPVPERQIVLDRRVRGNQGRAALLAERVCRREGDKALCSLSKAQDDGSLQTRREGPLPQAHEPALIAALKLAPPEQLSPHIRDEHFVPGSGPPPPGPAPVERHVDAPVVAQLWQRAQLPDGVKDAQRVFCGAAAQRKMLPERVGSRSRSIAPRCPRGPRRVPRLRRPAARLQAAAWQAAAARSSREAHNAAHDHRRGAWSARASRGGVARAAHTGRLSQQTWRHQEASVPSAQQRGAPCSPAVSPRSTAVAPRVQPPWIAPRRRLHLLSGFLAQVARELPNSLVSVLV